MITGPSSGIGRATAIELGARGFHVIAAGRSETRTRPVLGQIESAGGTAEFLHLDLASLTSAASAARVFVESSRMLDALVNNAGIGTGRGITEDGFELHFGVNHLGHFMLTQRLMPALGPSARIVQVSSAAHFNAEGIDFDRLRGRTRSVFGWKEYGVSKLANVLFVREMARRHPEWSSYAVHPGMTDTNIFPRIVRPLVRNRLLTPEEGAETVIWCANSDDVVGESGLYYQRKESRPPSEVAQDDELAVRLWESSERWCGESHLD